MQLSSALVFKGGGPQLAKQVGVFSLLCCVCLSLVLVQEQLFDISSNWTEKISANSSGGGDNRSTNSSSGKHNNIEVEEEEEDKEALNDQQQDHLIIQKQQTSYFDSIEAEYDQQQQQQQQLVNSSASSSTGTGTKQIKFFKPKSIFSRHLIDNLCSSEEQQHSRSLCSELSELSSSRQRRRRRRRRRQPNSSLLNLKNVTYQLAPEQRIQCGVTRDDDNDDMGWTLLIVVNSKWSNFKRRQRMRDTWLNQANIRKQICSSWTQRENKSTDANDGTNFKGQAQKGRSRSRNRNSKSKGRSSAFIISRIEYTFALGTSWPSRAPGESTGSSRGSSRGSRGWPEETQINEEVLSEWEQYRDLLVINLHESYHSMSLKHLSIFKWILKIGNENSSYSYSSSSSSSSFTSTSTSDADADNSNNKILNSTERNIRRSLRRRARDEERTLVLKCDDDAQVNLNQLLAQFYASKLSSGASQKKGGGDLLAAAALPATVMSKQHDHQQQGGDHKQSSNGDYLNDDEQVEEEEDQSGWIMCARFPANTAVLRQPNRKWRLTRQEYEFDTFPAYCSGLAYLAPKALIRRLYLLAHAVLWKEKERNYESPLWVDDVFITGVLISSLAERPKIFPLNSRFCYKRAQQSQGGGHGRGTKQKEDLNLISQSNHSPETRQSRSHHLHKRRQSNRLPEACIVSELSS